MNGQSASADGSGNDSSVSPQFIPSSVNPVGIAFGSGNGGCSISELLARGVEQPPFDQKYEQPFCGLTAIALSELVTARSSSVLSGPQPQAHRRSGRRVPARVAALFAP